MPMVVPTDQITSDAEALSRLRPYTPEGRWNALKCVEGWLIEDGIQYQWYFYPEGPVLEAMVGREGGPRQAVVVHLDIVPPKDDIEVQLIDGVFKAPGAADMIVQAAGMRALLQELRDRDDVCLSVIYAIDEEAAGRHSMAAYAEEHGDRFALVIAPEATERPSAEGHNFALVIQSKGPHWLRVTITGQQSHAGYGFDPKNGLPWALRLAVAIEDELTDLEMPAGLFQRRRTAVASVFNSGYKTNVGPATATFEVDMRLFPGDDARTFKPRVMELFAGLRIRGEGPPSEVTCTVEVINDLPAANVDPKHPLVRALLIAGGVNPDDPIAVAKATGAAEGWADASWFSGKGIEFGPGWFIHSPHERVSLDAVCEWLQIMLRWVELGDPILRAIESGKA